MKISPRIAIYTLGCKVNQYESQKIKDEFASQGCAIVDYDQEADVYIVNSCTVTGIADRKTRQMARRSKKINPSAITAVIGCYVKTDEAALAEIEEIDVLLDSDNKDGIVARVLDILAKDGRYIQDGAELVEDKDVNADGVHVHDFLHTEDRTRAYIKIQDGCDRFCAYCIIPYARAGLKNKPVREIIDEVKLLVAQGYKEIVVTGINMALYCCDTIIPANSAVSSTEMGIHKDDRNVDLLVLLRLITAIPGDFRIRLGSLEPNVLGAEAISALAKLDKICPQFHLSLQSGSDRVLNTMNRRYTRADYIHIVTALREVDPLCSITTDIIVGFPGETEEDFEESLSIVDICQFSHVHVFRYSKRKGTAAYRMPNQVDEKVKSARSTKLIRAAEVAANEFRQLCSGHTRQALVLNGTRAITDNGIEVMGLYDERQINRFVDVVL